MRWAEAKDDDSHRYLIPADRVDEFASLDERIGEYWEHPEDYDDQPDWPVEFPDWAKRIGGGRLTFTDPQLNGEPFP